MAFVKHKGTRRTTCDRAVIHYEEFKLLEYARDNYPGLFWVSNYIKRYARFVKKDEIDLIVNHYNNTNGEFPTLKLEEHQRLTFYAVKIGGFVHRVYALDNGYVFGDCCIEDDCKKY